MVPVGLTRYRDGLEPLEPFGKKEAEVLLDAVGVWQERLRKETGVGFVYASDEWYLLAGRPLPSQEMYEG